MALSMTTVCTTIPPVSQSFPFSLWNPRLRCLSFFSSTHVEKKCRKVLPSQYTSVYTVPPVFSVNFFAGNLLYWGLSKHIIFFVSLVLSMDLYCYGSFDGIEPQRIICSQILFRHCSSERNPPNSAKKNKYSHRQLLLKIGGCIFSTYYSFRQHHLHNPVTVRAREIVI